MNQYKINSEKELDAVAEDILVNFKDKTNIFALYGKMASGKTSLIKAFCRLLKCTEAATSPTFAIVNEYCTESRNKIYHFDFYRIESTEEVYDMGYEEYFYDNEALVFIEWPEMIENLLPKNHIKIIITETETGMRNIEVSEKNKGL